MIFGITLDKFERLKTCKKVSIITKLQLLRTSKYKFKTKDIYKMSFANFVDCENAIENEDFKKFITIFVIKKFYQTVYLHNLELILKDYANQKSKLVEDNDFIFNPPRYGDPPKQTLGSELRSDFVKRFGNWVVLTDLVCKGDITKYKEIEQWTVNDFFFWANYLTGQKIVENVK